ncbi:hypothetical protein BGP89_09745 [Luteimonas sp. JM171]|uniref:hypothetical protein n=1 Tax=Luteimonas sp. JM171 TaxID=1896164 RepID=UPI0008575BC2|nr:hypothetical protein [Luteimonas sp. JM171]AOH36601.1 hypothetical protein BGP89_09745 [Luteimonas sp. JM171]
MVVLPALGLPGQALARVAQARIDRVDSPVAVLHQVRVRLEWVPGAPHGDLLVAASRAHAPDLGYSFEDLVWTCPLRRPAEGETWHCRGELRAGGAAPMRLAVQLGPETMGATLEQDGARLGLHQPSAEPGITHIDLARVPLAWAQALVAQAWPAARLGAGTIDGQLALRSGTDAPLAVDASFSLANAAFETVDASAAGEALDIEAQVRFRQPGGTAMVAVDGTVEAGALLFGNAFVDLADARVALAVDAMRDGPDAPWHLPRFEWHDGPALTAQGSAAMSAGGGIDELHIELASDDASLLPARYLSGWLSVAGMRDLRMRGGLDGRLAVSGGAVRDGRLRLRDLDLHGQDDRFRFAGLDGEVLLASAQPAESAFGWRQAAVGGIEFGPARLPLRSAAGELRLREPVAVDVLGGRLLFDEASVRLPADGLGLGMELGLSVDGVQVEQLSQAFGWPRFGGTLSGRIPAARYADERLVLEGGLSMQVFDGRVDVGSLSMDRPFGVLPTLSADLEIHELDLYAITGVFGFGDVTGRLSGSIDGLRLVDWRLSSFDAQLATVPRRGVRQRISQRAVQNISSVGEGMYIGGLQGWLIGFFDDFGYSRIGLSCRLANEVCRMGGLRSVGNAFTIVEGAGIPHLRVIGHNRNVDWPTLVERIGAAIGGEVAPVVD